MLGLSISLEFSRLVTNDDGVAAASGQDRAGLAEGHDHGCILVQPAESCALAARPE